MKHRYTVSVLLAGILWGVIGLFVRALNTSGLGSMQVVFVRAFLAALMLFIGLLILRRDLLKIRLRDLWCFVGTGVFSITFFNFCYFYTMTETSLAVASVLLYTAPVFVAILSSIFFGERMAKIGCLSLLLALVGCVLVTGLLFDVPKLSPFGILVGVGAGVGYALYSIFGRCALNRGYHTLTVNAWTFIIATAALFPFARLGDLASSISAGTFPWINSLLLALVSTVLPYLLYTYGLKGMEGGRASVLATVEPVVATLTGVIFFKESLDGWSIVGILLVLAAVLLLNLKGRGRDSHLETPSDFSLD